MLSSNNESNFQVKETDPQHVRAISQVDFEDALKRVRRSVPPDTLDKYEEWNKGFGDISTS